MRKATELEIIAHAKAYLDKLANGINPLTNEALEEHEIVNNVRISRCLFFVSDVLRQVIEKGGLQGLKSSRSVYTEPFHLTQEQRTRFPYSKSPMYISAIAKQLNELAGSSEMKPLSHAAISGFMEWQGYLCQPAAAAGQPKRCRPKADRRWASAPSGASTSTACPTRRRCTAKAPSALSWRIWMRLSS